ncbi:MAG: HPr family phosphocarrier protein [Chlorobiaceae bacterium]|nr:HPr family phosphocarrier protein [Chlorobiaceae bacterium]
MINKHLTVKAPAGLHFRALGKIHRISREHQCTVLFEKENGETANSESYVEMLALCAILGTTLQVTVDGLNETKALEMIQEVFENGAGI